MALFSSGGASSGAQTSSLHPAVAVAVGGGAAVAVLAAYKGIVPHDWLIKQLSEPVIMPAIRLLDPETAHVVAVKSAALGLAPKDKTADPESLRVKVFGREFPNPLGMAAGFDKDAEAMEGLLDMGFGFVEIGSVTPQPQIGNPKPRVFRLSEDNAVINRYGFNSQGLESVAQRLKAYVATRNDSIVWHRPGVLGVNLGKNKTTEDAAADYVQGVQTLGKYADYLVVNVSSPNTPGLRSLQGKQQLQELVSRVLKARDEVEAKEGRKIPLLVKIAPDLTSDDKKDIADVALTLKLDGLIVSNTTLSRPDTLKSNHKGETGGLSGAPVRELSTQVLYDMYKLTKGSVPLIGVGGVSSGKDAYDKIKAGATLVQMYSCLVYDGPLAVPRAKQELAELLAADGYTSVAQAIGAAHKK